MPPSARRVSACLIQPPFAQLNSPYPGIFYIRSFLEKRGIKVFARDHSIGLFEKIFCREGLGRVFADAAKLSYSGRFKRIIKRFLSEESRWLSEIDHLTAFLKGQDREWGHFLARATCAMPGGPRFDALLAELRNAAAPEDASLLASKLLADIADFITVTLDPCFSLVRYVPSPLTELDLGFRDFASVKAGLNGYVMCNFYRPFLETEWKEINSLINTDEHEAASKLFLGLSIPFPGCLAGALACAESAKAFFKGTVCTIAGGGYVNTELRFLTDKHFFNFFDYLSFDRGYGSLDAIIKREAYKASGDELKNEPLYKTMFLGQHGNIVKGESINGNSDGDGKRIDDEAVTSIFPDYSGVDFSRYICPMDDCNPMHRLWSDGRWIKAYAAHGCYWQKCVFCDTSLDYIRCYQPVDMDALFTHLLAQAKAAGTCGIHLVDEACPPSALARFAALNSEAGLPLVFWGNIRFEKTFIREASALAAGGLIGVSAGIEVASEKGFKRIGKGMGLADVVNICAAFKQAGVMVHAYLIYGYWDESEQEIIDSAEIVRQLFAAGLLDSAFWHKFALTVHSRLYAEKLKGLHPELIPLGDIRAGAGTEAAPNAKPPKIFALNDLSFKGENRFDRYAAPLEQLLARWMRGDCDTPVQNAFPFNVPKPSVAANLIHKLL
jgi:hypothetical protein